MIPGVRSIVSADPEVAVEAVAGDFSIGLAGGGGCEISFCGLAGGCEIGGWGLAGGCEIGVCGFVVCWVGGATVRDEGLAGGGGGGGSGWVVSGRASSGVGSSTAVSISGVCLLLTLPLRQQQMHTQHIPHATTVVSQTPMATGATKGGIWERKSNAVDPPPPPEETMTTGAMASRQNSDSRRDKW
jgi:hypothetical protein